MVNSWISYVTLLNHLAFDNVLINNTVALGSTYKNLITRLIRPRY